MSTSTLPSPRTTASQASPTATALDRRHPLVVGATVVGLGLLWLQIWLVGISLVLWIATGWSPTVITGGSMAPTLPAGQLVLVDSSSAADIGVNDIIVFDHPGSDGHLVTHRVTSIDAAGTIVTRGDANSTPDSTPVTDATLHGRVRVVVPFVGLPRVWLQHREFVPLGLFCAIDVLVMIACNRVLRGDDPTEQSSLAEPETGLAVRIASPGPWSSPSPWPSPGLSPWGPPTGPPVVAGTR